MASEPAHLEFSNDALTAPEWLDSLRRTAEEACRAHDWAALHAMAGQLRRDTAMWADLWGPACAVAARHVGDPAARALLDEAIAAGFSQRDTFQPELPDAFGADPDWAELAARIDANAAPVPLLLTRWPVITPTAPLTLFAIAPERAEELRGRLPALAPTAWETALTLLGWVSNRWRHANSHMEIDDAVECLDRVDAGGRFACVEYTLVLSQALNAAGIPARRLSLRQAGYHAGVGRGHVVSEAWIDELSRWVVLDGQNGCYWAGADGSPLSTLQLQDRSGEPPRAAPAPGVDAKDREEQLFWLSYFASVSTTGLTWSSGDYVPVFQRTGINATPRLLHDGRQAYPDLSELAVGLEIAGRDCAIRLTTEHPYARGFVARHRGEEHELPLDSPVWPLPTSPGPHDATLAVRTPYGLTAARPLEYRVHR